MRPIVLELHQLHRSYRGGAAIARFRGTEPAEQDAPEDWVGSTTTIFGDARRGLSKLPDGRLLRDAIAADPEAFLGRAHAERFGSDPALLVKLLHAGERLPVHCHPSRVFARRHLDCPFGKTEAWVIVETEGERPLVHLGFRRDVDAATLAGWVERQETTTMLRALHTLEVRPGDAVLVPAGVPHAIGEGVFVVELQEPTDFSVLLERGGFVTGPADGHLGIGYDLALTCVDRSGFGEETIARLRRRAAEAREVRPGVWNVLLTDADPYFRAERLLPRPSASLEPAFSIVVVVDGAGRLETDHGGVVPLVRGDTVLVPHASGAGRIDGPVEAIRCLPPLLDITIG